MAEKSLPVWLLVGANGSTTWDWYISHPTDLERVLGVVSASAIPLSRQLACAKRTVERERKRMAKMQAQGTPFNRFAWEAEIGNMDAIVITLEKLAMLEEISNEMRQTEFPK